MTDIVIATSEEEHYLERARALVGPADLAATANREHRLAGEAFNSALEHAIAAGAALKKAKAQLKHGEWLPWLAANFDGSKRTAQAYMRLAANAQHAAYVDVAGLSQRAVLKRLERVEREAKADERQRQFDNSRCDDCGRTRRELMDTDTPNASGWFSVAGGGQYCSPCFNREQRRANEEREASLTEEERRERDEAKADFKAKQKLEGSLRAFIGEGSVAEFLRLELRALSTAEGWRYPDLLDSIITEMADVEQAARLIREWAEGQLDCEDGR